MQLWLAPLAITILILGIYSKPAAIQIAELQLHSHCESSKHILPKGKTIQSRFLPPLGYERVAASRKSYAHYLRTLPLKPHGAHVIYHDGTIKPNNGVYDAVINMPIGKRNLHQCADAVMRLRAEYLWKHKQYDKIHFNFTNGFRVAYSTWMQGNRVVVQGNKSWWKAATTPSNSYNSFWKYLETIFSYAGSYSLAKELQSVHLNDIAIGDVFIQGGFPGHAVIVVDMAIHKTNGTKAVLLAQSYMPAQEIQILKNPNQPKLSPWYIFKPNEEIVTPEWRFKASDLKRFP